MNKTQNHAPAISVVIPTLGRPIIAETIESLAGTTMAGQLEVLVAGHIRNNEILEKINALSSAFLKFRHLDISFESGDSSNKKNAGLKESSAEVVVFIDDDVKVLPDWPEQILKPFEDPFTGMVSGPSLTPENLPLMARLSGKALASGAAGYVANRYSKGKKGTHEINWSGIIGCNMAFRKKILEEIGGFDVTFWPGEEMVASFKTSKGGHKIIFQPDAALYHYPRASLWGFIKQVFGYGATRIRLMRAGLDFEVTTIVPALMIVVAATLAISAFFCLFSLQLLAILAALYLISDIFFTLHFYYRNREKTDLLLFFLIPLMHISYGIGEWSEFFIGNRDLSVKGGSG